MRWHEWIIDVRTGSERGAPMSHGALRIEPRRFLERANCAAVIETMKQCQALVEVTLRLCAFRCDLARVRAEPVVKWLTSIAACAKNERENGPRKYVTDPVHKEIVSVSSSIATASCRNTNCEPPANRNIVP